MKKVIRLNTDPVFERCEGRDLEERIAIFDERVQQGKCQFIAQFLGDKVRDAIQTTGGKGWLLHEYAGDTFYLTNRQYAQARKAVGLDPIE